MFLLLVYCAAMIALYLAPLGITSPCIMEENQLPPKPALVGHRGAPMVSDQHPGSGQGGWGRLLPQEKPGCGAQILVATGLDKLWPAQNSGVPTAARVAQAWRMGEHRVRRGMLQLQDRAAS